MRPISPVVAFAVAALASAAAVPAAAQSRGPNPPPQLVVHRVSADLAAEPPTVLIEGTNLGSNAQVRMGTENGVMPMTVLSASDTAVVAVLPTTTPGTYMLTVWRGPATTQGFSVDLTIGAVGATGAPGAQGPQGVVGPMGPIGLTGAQGPVGPQGDQGLTGPIGPVGPQGPTGPKGDTGTTGPAGPAGPKGDTGAVGLTGVQGPQGSQGEPGPAGTINADLITPGPAGPALGIAGVFSLTAPTYSEQCATHAVVTGLTGTHDGTWVTSLKATCKKSENITRLSPVGIYLAFDGGTSSTGTAGVGGGSNFSTACPAGTMAIGIHGKVGLISGRIRAIGLRCAPLLSGTTTNSTSAQGANSIGTDLPWEIPCGPGRVATGIEGQENNNGLLSLTFTCR